MGGTATLIGVAYLVVVVLGVLVAVGVWRSTLRRRPVDPERLAERERTWLFVVVGILVSLLFATIFFAPYGQSASGPHQVVDVHAQQFVWILRPETVRAGEPVEFRIRSRDVNHAFAVYDRGTFIAQAQVMPGHTQKLVHTFHRAGTYDVLCTEYCGVGHAQMIGHFQVTK